MTDGEDVFQTRIHGRGGQGVVTAAELLSVAAFRGGRHAQAFPSFGSERFGAPVVAYCRISDTHIRSREPIVAPDAVLVQDPTLLATDDVFDGLGPDCYVLINSARDLAELAVPTFAPGRRADRLMTLPATELARRHLGRPLPNAVMLGGFAALTGVVSLDDVISALAQRFGGEVLAGNQQAARAAFDHVSRNRGGLYASTD